MSRALLVSFFTLVAALFVASSSQALTLPIVGLGVDVGRTCLPSAPSCSAAPEFTLGANVTTTGAFDYTPLGGGAGTMDITLSLADFSMAGTGPDGVEEIVFSGIQISVPGWSTFDPLDDLSSIFGLGTGTATITGSYTQLDGSSGVVVGATAINQVVDATSLNCLLSPAGVGQCGVSFGSSRDFQISVGSANAETQDVQLTGNFLLVPEPSTALLVGLGLVVTGMRRRANA